MHSYEKARFAWAYYHAAMVDRHLPHHLYLERVKKEAMDSCLRAMQSDFDCVFDEWAGTVARHPEVQRVLRTLRAAVEGVVDE